MLNKGLINLLIFRTFAKFLFKPEIITQYLIKKINFIN